MITAEIVADSVYKEKRITSFLLTYPRFIHSEFMTHRQITKNSSSSRAIPVKKLIEDIRNNPAMPIHWGKAQKGMQADNEVDELTKTLCVDIWLASMENAIDSAERLLQKGIHKQVANRLLEPYAHMRVLATATDWDNLYALRAHRDAQPEFRELAHNMICAYIKNTPKQLNLNEWHIPYCDRFVEGLTIEQKLKVGTARAARTSYMSFNNEINYEDDYRLHDDLFSAGHMSPFEHLAQAVDSDEYFGNFKGWLQYRKTFPKNVECKSFDYDEFIKERGILI